MSSNTLSSVPIFSPTQISGCQLWLDAADVNGNGSRITDGSSVSTWVDKSGNGRNGTTIGANPTFSSNAVQFNNQGLATTLSGGTNIESGFFIASFTNTNNANSLFCSGTGSRQFRVAGGTIQTVRQGIANILTSGSALANSTKYLIEYTTNGTTLTHFLNGSTYASGSSGSFGAGTTNVGGTIEGMVGFIQEVIVYNYEVSTSERQQVEGYLAWKWSLQASLPATHPYKNSQVYPINTLPSQFTNITTIPLAPSSAPFVFFRPTSITGCQLWLDGYDPNGNGSSVANGSTVSTWVDKSGNGKNATASGTPTYLSGGGISFNGTNAYYTNTSFAFDLSKRSVFIILKVNSYLVNAGVMPFIPNPSSGTDASTTTGMSVETVTNAIRFYSNSGGYLGDIPTTLTNINMYNDNLNLTAGTQYLNGNLTGSPIANYTPGTTSGYVLGARWLSGAISLAYALTGNIYEIVLYSTTLSTRDRQNVEGYLAWKWNLVANLPSNHPFKNAPPGLPVPSVPPRLTMSSSSFSPLRFSGIALWLDAADTQTLTLAGQNVSAWADKSGNGYNATPFATGPQLQRGILNGNPGLYFNGTNTMAMIAGKIATGTNFSIFSVARYTGSGELLGVWKVQVSSYFIFSSANTVKVGIGTSGAYVEYGINTAVTQNVNQITSAVLTSDTVSSTGTLNAGVNGSVSSYSIPGGPNTNSCDQNFTVGGLSETGTFQYGFTGYIHEVVFYRSSLSTSQRQSVEGYLAWKWGLQANLPATHPFKKFPPPP
jgi:hypothetical protein